MKKLLLAVLTVTTLVASATAAGGAGPCLATCFLGDVRIGYYMNEGKPIETEDWIVFAGNIIASPVGSLFGGFQAYQESETATGFCVGALWGRRAGSEINTYKLRTKEILLLIPCVQCYPAIAIPFEAFSGKTWSEVVSEEGLQK